MSDNLSEKDVISNAKRLMQEESYDQALNNWMYLKKHKEEFDPYVQWNIAKCHAYLDSKVEAAEAYKVVIKYMADNPNKLDNTIFLESLFSLGILEKERRNYSKAMDAFLSFLDYQQKHNLPIPKETLDTVEGEYQSCKDIIDNKIKGTKGDSHKNVPYATAQVTTKKQRTQKGKPYQRLKNVAKEEQRAEMDKMWQEMEDNKMNIEEGSKWYIVSADWFKQWKDWSGFSTTSKISEAETTNDAIESGDSPLGTKVEEPGRIDNYDILESSELMLFGEYNLKDNLTEEQDYVIVNPEIWRYLMSIYDGTPILRTAIKNIDNREDTDTEECIIEVNLVKLYIFEVPRENKQDYYEVMLASRNWDFMDVKMRICHK